MLKLDVHTCSLELKSVLHGSRSASGCSSVNHPDTAIVMCKEDPLVRESKKNSSTSPILFLIFTPAKVRILIKAYSKYGSWLKKINPCI